MGVGYGSATAFGDYACVYSQWYRRVVSMLLVRFSTWHFGYNSSLVASVHCRVGSD